MDGGEREAGQGRADAPSPGSGLPQGLKQGRRLPERLLVAAHQACDLGVLDMAARLLALTESLLHDQSVMAGIPPATLRRIGEALIAGHHRLWHLRHPTPD